MDNHYIGSLQPASLRGALRSVMQTVFLCLVALLLLVPSGGVAYATQEASLEGTSQSSSTSSQDDSRVFVVLESYISWDDITPESTPHLYQMAEQGGAADLNSRSRNRYEGTSASADEMALTISSGFWAAYSETALGAYNAQDVYQSGTAGEAYTRITGSDPGNDEIVYLGMPVALRDNTGLSSNIVLGTLGQLVKDAGGTTAALGNSDIRTTDEDKNISRPAALLAMDEEGRVTFGDVSQNVLQQDPDAPYGQKTDLARFQTGLDEIVAAGDEAGGPSLVVLDSGDLNRTDKYGKIVSPERKEMHFDEALSTLDDVVGMALAAAGAGDTVIVSSCASYDSSAYELLAPLLVAGGVEGEGTDIASDSDLNGVLTSSSTHRAGLVTSMDVTASVLDILGISVPANVGGSPLFANDGLYYGVGIDGAENSGEEVTQAFSELTTSIVVTDQARSLLIVSFIAVFLIVLIASLAWFFLQRSHSKRERAEGIAELPLKYPSVFMVGKAVLLAVISFPLATLLAYLFVPNPLSIATIAGLSGVITLVIWGIALVIWRLWGMRISYAFICLLTTLILLVDQWLGSPLSVMGIFGYSPSYAARFYGIGNEGAGIIFGSSLIGFALLFDQFDRNSRFWRLMRSVGFLLFSLLAILTMAAPFWGANVAVAIWGIAGYGVAWLLFNNIKITPKVVALSLGICVVAVAALALVDLYGPGEDTHFAKLIVAIQEGGFMELANMVARKVAVNLGVLFTSNWSFVLIGVLLALGILKWIPSQDFDAMSHANPAFSHAIAASLFGGLIAFLTEDSGILIPALFFVYLAPALVWLIFDARLQRDPAADRFLVSGAGVEDSKE